MKLTSDMIDEFVDLLSPLAKELDDRRALIFGAFGNNTSLGARIKFGSCVLVFLTNLAATLSEFGTIEEDLEAFVVLLRSAHSQVGADKKKRIVDLIQQCLNGKLNYALGFLTLGEHTKGDAKLCSQVDNLKARLYALRKSVSQNDTQDGSKEFVDILRQLNLIALQHSHISFNDMCRGML